MLRQQVTQEHSIVQILNLGSCIVKYDTCSNVLRTLLISISWSNMISINNRTNGGGSAWLVTEDKNGSFAWSTWDQALKLPWIFESSGNSNSLRQTPDTQKKTHGDNVERGPSQYKSSNWSAGNSLQVSATYFLDVASKLDWNLHFFVTVVLSQTHQKQPNTSPHCSGPKESKQCHLISWKPQQCFLWTKISS